MIRAIIVSLILVSANVYAVGVKDWYALTAEDDGAAYVGTAWTNLVARWDFNSGSGSLVLDTTGNGINMVQPVSSNQPVISGGYATLDGGDFMATVQTNFMDNERVTLTCWVNWQAFVNYGVIFGSSPWVATGGKFTGLEFDTTVTRKIYGVIGNNVGVSPITVLSAIPCPSNQWVFLAVTRQSIGRTELVINESHFVSSASSNRPIAISAPWSFGFVNTTNANFYLTGSFDEARIYNRLLSSNEMQAVRLEGRP